MIGQLAEYYGLLLLTLGIWRDMHESVWTFQSTSKILQKSSSEASVSRDEA